LGPVPSDLVAVQPDDDLAVLDHDFELVADPARGHRIARRADTNGLQPVDCPLFATAQRRPQRGQRSHPGPLSEQALRGRRLSLAVHPAVHLHTPDSRLPVGRIDLAAEAPGRHHQVGLDVPGQMLDHPLRLWVPTLTEVRPEAECAAKRT
jgi:hypothetical protein